MDDEKKLIAMAELKRANDIVEKLMHMHRKQWIDPLNKYNQYAETASKEWGKEHRLAELAAIGRAILGTFDHQHEFANMTYADMFAEILHLLVCQENSAARIINKFLSDF